MQITKVTRRLYTRGEDKTPCSVARAHEFVEMKIEIRYDSRAGDTHDAAILHDVWEAARFDALQDALDFLTCNPDMVSEAIDALTAAINERNR